MKSVLISGAGIAGPTLAYWLRAAGFEPTLVERAPALRSGGYVIDFWGLGYSIAEQMGLLPEIDRDGYHVQELRIVDEAGRRLAGFGTGVFAELTNGRYVTLQRSRLSRLLFERISGGVETIFGDEIVLVEERADCVEVQLERGGRRRCDLLVGADGLHSAVRRLVFGPQRKFERYLGYVVAAFEVHGYRPRDEDVYLIYGRPGRMVGRFTLRDDRTLFLLIFAADRAVLPETPEAQKELLRGIYGSDGWECDRMLEELERTGELYFDAVSQIKMPDWSRGRVALIGDAAFCVSLLAGQGSALAMISAYVLAGELAAAGDRYSTAFAQYEARLKNYIDRKQQGAERFAGALAPKTRLGMHFRNLAVRSFSVPGLAKLSIGRDMADQLELPGYHWLVANAEPHLG
ncbi:2-polyprenyl-6-methoxyphenol hydroxylase-like FAD-dependent oxidoreductase [Bradyrhizobium sp. R2.2-H]|jgi:2-polyprenyl-6-methoxyphenol hydroxylase-like FAD-dependent oxidoreductase|uniref:FAD-binding domain n=1 Tax=unclassified Bradyrhizobium TaxID=2631580 RepID=UPI001047EECC|nr:MULTISPECIES: FAD-binding domain [unclassified Bradyrhizobium]TCU69300.1 2-polyprenyl-6-methoxyphenol hydroxylase-like FAD-dependent oxidoreductase [Bradyrhizobium sp. Y-H1]TCU70792.1 2-polyprenyl-6-methoxyphenol hydroxylase-like FAD-dependent oxidoreductase [Bradyrhizobium sp. R2.2-H]